MSFIKKYQTGNLVSNPSPIKYKIKFDDGEAEFDQEDFEKELIQDPEYVSLTDDNKSRYRGDLENIYSKAGQVGGLSVSSIGGKEVSGFKGIDENISKYRSPEEIDAIKGRKERRAAKEEYNRTATQNRIFANTALRLKNKKALENKEKLDAEQLDLKNKSYQNYNTSRNFFAYTYGANQAGTGNFNEANEMRRINQLPEAERNSLLTKHAQEQRNLLLNLDENDKEVSDKAYKDFGIGLKEVKEKIKNLDLNSKEGAMSFLDLTKNKLSTRYLYDPDFYKDYEPKEGVNQEVVSQSPQSTNSVAQGVKKDEEGNIQVNPEEYTIADTDEYDPSRNLFSFGGKKYSYKEAYDLYKSNTKLGNQFRTARPDFLKDTKVITPENSFLIDINEAKKQYGSENSILPLFTGYTHVADLSDTMDISSKDPNTKIIKATNEGVIQNNAYSNIQDSTYTFVVKNVNGKAQKFKATESEDELGNYVYTYKDEKGVTQTIKGKTTKDKNSKYTPFNFSRIYNASDLPDLTKKWFNKNGGSIPKLQRGGSLYFGGDKRVNKTADGEVIQEKGTPINQSKASAGNVLDKDFKLSTADKLQVGSILADVTSLGIGLTGAGAPLSAAVGAAGSGMQYASDIKRDGVTWGNSALLAGNLALDVVSAIPVAGNFAKGAKVVKGLKYASNLLTGFGLTKSAEAAARIASDPLNANLDDYQSLVSGLRMLKGGRSQRKNIDTKRPEVSFKAKVGDEVKTIKLSSAENSTLKGLDTNQQAQFLKNKAKESDFKNIDLEKINIISESRRKTIKSRYNSIKDRTPFLKNKGKDIDRPEYTKTEYKKAPFDQEEINAIRSKEEKWGTFSPIYKGYKKTFGIPTAGSAQRKLNLENENVRKSAIRTSLKEEGVPMTKGGNTKVDFDSYSKRKYKAPKTSSLKEKEVLNPGEYVKFIKKNPEFKGKSPEEIIDIVQQKAKSSAWSSNMKEYKSKKSALEPEIKKSNEAESKRVSEAKETFKKKETNENKKVLEQRKKDNLAEDVAERRDSREKAKERLSEYKRKSDEKAKKDLDIKNKRDKEIAEYKRTKSQNKKVGKERAKEVAKNKDLKKNVEELRYEKLSKKNQESLESATQGRKKRVKIKKAQKGLSIIKPKFNVGIIDRDRYKAKAIKPLGFNKISMPTKLTPSKDLMDWTEKRTSRNINDYSTENRIDNQNKNFFKSVGSDIKSISSKIDPIFLSETGRAISNIISNRGMDTGVDVALQQAPAESYLRETGIGASGLANREANRLMNSSKKNMTSDSKLNYLLLRDSENKANAVREKGIYQDIDAANRIREINSEKASQYNNLRSQIANSNIGALNEASNKKRTMNNQIRTANADTVNNLWASNNAKRTQNIEAGKAYDRYINEGLIQAQYDQEMLEPSKKWSNLMNDKNATPEAREAARQELLEASKIANWKKYSYMRKNINGGDLMQEFNPNNKKPIYKKGGTMNSTSDFYKMKGEITKDMNNFLKELRTFSQKRGLIQYKNATSKRK